ncbi:MAG: DNA polymerase/3'-5' exonuclease PolX [Desulfobacteraceae bacterium]|nr:DNA polymerase/3'-5' exonuclease PolX [Desulfobacteraceae bacterium]
MAVRNGEVAEIFNRLADLLDIEGANSFRVRAYRNAATVLNNLPRSAADMIEHDEDLAKLPGIGKDLAMKIREVVETGTLVLLRELERRTPSGLRRMMHIPGLGPKKVLLLYECLGVDSVEALERAARTGRVREVPGFGEKTEKRILEEIERRREEGDEGRSGLMTAEEIVQPLLSYLRQIPGVRDAVAAGSFRRRQETVGDLDILVTCRRSCEVMERFAGYEAIERVISRGETRSTVVFRSGIQVDLRLIPATSYGAALHYFTGSRAHSIALRKMAQKNHLKINEYGVFRKGKRVAGRTEEEIYAQFGLPYIEPELREDRGEIAAAAEGSLPRLVRIEDIRGDLHSHTRATDGRASLQEMALAARERGYEYIAITDHTQSVAIAHGQDASRLAQQIAEIDRLNEKLEGIVILKAAEVDILEDGSLDLPDEILKELDLTVCSIHSRFHLPREKQTERIIRAMDNPYFNILAHPTGRLIHGRPPYGLHMERLMEAAVQRGCFMELNAQPDRLDLNDVHCRMARDLGLKIAVSSDAHVERDLDFMRFGIGQARRGWLEACDVLNTRSWEVLRKLLKRV